jgi:PAS domain S-box-containing protein
VDPTETPAKRRSVAFSNALAVILIAANILLFVIIPGNHNVGGLSEMIYATAIFSIAIIFNRFSLNNLSSIYLSWVPPLLIAWLMIDSMRELEGVTPAAYFGIRIYFLATSCIPFLLIGRNNLPLLILGLLPSFLLLIFCDFFLLLAGVNISEELVNGLTQTRSLIAYLVIGGSCFVLKTIVGETDAQNEALIKELRKKNEIISSHAKSELKLLNAQLERKVNELSRREIIFKRSEEIAKVGSWELNLAENSMFWSDQMYEIFGVNKMIDLNSPELTNQLFQESGPKVVAALKELILSRKTYDLVVPAKTPLGYKKWVRVVGFPLIINEKVTGVSGIVHDITLYKEAEERVRINEQNYRALFEQASDAIMVIDFWGKFMDVNTSMCKLLDFTREELLMMNVRQVIDEDDLKKQPLRFDTLAAGNQLYRELLMIRKNGPSVFVESNIKKINEGRIVAIVRDISARKLAESEKEKVRHSLNERIKELTTLYKSSQILQSETQPVHEVMQEMVMILPSGWQYPSISAAKISIGGMEFVTPNYGAYRHMQRSSFTTRNNLSGTIELVYLEECPDEAEGPFLAEERKLINMLGEMVRTYLDRRYESDALKRSEANQSATINNANYLIWSVSSAYELISFNKPFAEFSKSAMSIDAMIGTRFPDATDEHSEWRGRWLELYNRALAGEAFKTGSVIREKKFEYSLNPIREDGKIIGVSVFGEDVSDRIQQQNQINDANKQIGELRLMALRSVMNPHFIFNCLNSIQYYIMENDQRNAVSYLSTFSKLIRSILNNSVKNRVRLSDEMDMLKLYIQLEALRFENKFDTFIHVDPEMDVDDVEIPSMLIQPYVENAILHGLYNKQGKGKLSITITSRDSMVLIEIEDDGLGRKAASALKNVNMKQHKSMGTTLTEERLRLINDDGVASVEIIDLENAGIATGTRVKLWIKE